MSDELNKEMEELEEVSEVEEASAPKATNPSSVKLKQEKENMQKAKTSGKASDPKATKGAVKPVSTVEDKEEDEDEEDEKEQEESVRQTPKLKSEILAGLVDHMKGLKKEDLAKIYGSTVLGEQDDDDDDEDPFKKKKGKDASPDTDDAAEAKVKKESIDQIIDKLDVSQDVEALVGGEEELSEEFKTKAATIFESAIKSKVRTELEKIQEENE